MDFFDTQVEGKGQGLRANFKTPKVNAIRQFPKGCGPYASRVHLHEVTKDRATVSRFAACANNSSIIVLRSLENSPNMCSPKPLEPYSSCLNRVDENGEIFRSLHSNIVHTDKDLIDQDQTHRNCTKSIEFAHRKCDSKRAMIYCTSDDEKGEALRSSHSDVVHTGIRTVENADKNNNPKRIKSYLTNRMNYNDMNKEAENCRILGSSSSGRKCSDFYVHRENVIKVLKMYEKLTSYLMVLRKKELESRKQVGMARIYIEAAMLLKKQGKWINKSKQIGSIHGFEIGDKFLNRAELNVTGIHQQFQAGIDYMKKDGKVTATSIVASGKYFDVVNSSETLLYSGHGGNPAVGKTEVRDQRLERGNLALKNSMETKSVVRVIKGVKLLRTCAREKMEESRCNFKYIYDGLYFVDDCRIERGNFGKLVFKFWLKRVCQQPKLTW